MSLNIKTSQGLKKINTVHIAKPQKEVSKKDVNFYDYDGTIVASYTKTEFLTLSTMPDNPTHQGLTAQGWNWSLADAKDYVADVGILNIGQQYITSDGKTRLYISLTEGRLSPVLGLGINGSVDVDWGDGTVHSTLTGSSVSTLVTTPHTYAQGGDYVITLTAAKGTTIAVLGTYTGSLLLTKGGTTNNEARVYQTSIKKVIFGDGITSIGAYTFISCGGLTSISIPNGITSIGASAFQNCYSLTSIFIPNSVTSIGNNAFQNCYSLASISIPNSVTSMGGTTFATCCSLTSITISGNVTEIGNNLFYNCYSLANISIPNRVTSIGASAFIGGYGVGVIRFEPTMPPVVGSSQSFSGIPTDCVIYVPQGTLEDYEGATNYPDPDIYQYVEY